MEVDGCLGPGARLWVEALLVEPKGPVAPDALLAAAGAASCAAAGGFLVDNLSPN